MGRRQAKDHMQRTAGLNTVLDPERLQQGSRDNGFEIELAHAVNVSIDDRGLPSLRNGGTLGIAGEFHSLFCQDGEAFLIQERDVDAAIMRIASLFPSVSLVGVRSGLTKDRRMTWAQEEGGDVFYSNGAQTGYIRAGVSSNWPVQIYTGPDADLQFLTAVPAPSSIAFLPGGQILIAIGNAIYSNHSPFQYGLFEQGHGNVAAFKGDVTMLAGVRDGFFASDGEKTWFFRKQDWYQFKQELVEAAGVLPGALAHDRVELQSLGVNATGFGKVWLSNLGVCLGTDDGSFTNKTKSKVAPLPNPLVSGACLVKGTVAIATTT